MAICASLALAAMGVNTLVVQGSYAVSTLTGEVARNPFRCVVGCEIGVGGWVGVCACRRVGVGAGVGRTHLNIWLCCYSGVGVVTICASLALAAMCVNTLVVQGSYAVSTLTGEVARNPFGWVCVCVRVRACVCVLRVCVWVWVGGWVGARARMCGGVGDGVG